MPETQTETMESRILRASRAAPLFARVADDLVLSLRRAMGVPDQAEPEVEAEFAALRARLDQQFRPEFNQTYAGLFTRQLGGASGVVLHALESGPVQAYLAVAERIDSEVQAALREYIPKLDAILRSSV